VGVLAVLVPPQAAGRAIAREAVTTRAAEETLRFTLGSRDDSSGQGPLKDLIRRLSLNCTRAEMQVVRSPLVAEPVASGHLALGAPHRPWGQPCPHSRLGRPQPIGHKNGMAIAGTKRKPLFLVPAIDAPGDLTERAR
jgi:hypothetical protein